MNQSLKSLRSHFAVLAVKAEMSVSVYKLGGCIIWKTTLFFAFPVQDKASSSVFLTYSSCVEILTVNQAPKSE